MIKLQFCIGKYPRKTKSAPTEVSAPKNANPNCRQTNFKQSIRIFRRIKSALKGFAVLPKSIALI